MLDIIIGDETSQRKALTSAVESLHSLTGLPLGVVMARDLVPRLTNEKVVVAGIPLSCRKWHLRDPVRGEQCRSEARKLFTLDWRKGLSFSTCAMGFDTFACPILRDDRLEAILFGHGFFLDKRPDDENIISLISGYGIDQREYFSDLEDVRVFSMEAVRVIAASAAKVIEAVLTSNSDGRWANGERPWASEDPFQPFVRKLSHEIRTPLAAIQVHAKRYMRRIAKGLPVNLESLRLSLEDISDGASQIESMIQRFSSFGDRSKRPFQVVSLRSICEEAWRMVRVSRGPGASRVSFACLIPSDCAILGDGYDLFRLFVNLFVNSWNSIDRLGLGHGNLRVISSYCDYHLAISVEDDGEGFPKGKGSPEERLRDHPVSGSGVGLTVINSVIADHGGRIELRDRDPSGAIVVVRFPRINKNIEGE